METRSLFSRVFLGNSVGLPLCRVLDFQDETELTASGNIVHCTRTQVNTCGMSALKGNDREGGVGPAGKASPKRR